MRKVFQNLKFIHSALSQKEKGQDEEQWIDLVNHHIGAKAHKIKISEKEFFHDLDNVIKAQGEPFGSTVG